MSDEMDDLKEVSTMGKKFIIWVTMFVLVVSGIVWALNRADRTIDVAIVHYEEFQDIWNSCQKINIDIGNMRAVPDTDVMFAQFSKNQRINTLKTNLNRWVEEYNAKSKMWNRSMWKSNSLPYQLSVNDFSNY